MRMRICYGIVLLLVGVMNSSVDAAEVTEFIQQVQAVQKKGEGNSQAAAAVKQLQGMGPETLLPLLAGMNEANPLAFNWLQLAFESIANKALQNQSLSASDLEAFVVDRTNHGRARKLAFDWLAKVDPSARERLIPTMLDDPSSPLRREAVAQVVTAAKSLEEESAQLALWQKALTGAVDKDQVDEIAAALKKLGKPVDVVQHFGLLTSWHVIGPFDNTDMKAFDVVYPPEKEIQLDGRYEGKLGEVKWEHFVSDKNDGAFDLAELTQPHKGAIDYAFTEFNSDRDQEVEFRLATSNAWKLWVNGELVFAREEYHRGMRFDQYIVRGEIKQGKNSFLLKVCQNEQTQDWAQRWAFQFRIVDGSGHAVSQTE